MSLREAAHQALEALDLLAKSEHQATNFTTKNGGRIYPHKVAVDAGVALRTALAEPEQEPVAWLYRDLWGTLKLSQIMPPPVGVFPVYTHPPQRKPLTDDELEDIAIAARKGNLTDLRNAIERAHGIGGEA